MPHAHDALAKFHGQTGIRHHHHLALDHARHRASTPIQPIGCRQPAGREPCRLGQLALTDRNQTAPIGVDHDLLITRTDIEIRSSQTGNIPIHVGHVLATPATVEIHVGCFATNTRLRPYRRTRAQTCPQGNEPSGQAQLLQTGPDTTDLLCHAQISGAIQCRGGGVPNLHATICRVHTDQTPRQITGASLTEPQRDTQTTDPGDSLQLLKVQHLATVGLEFVRRQQRQRAGLRHLAVLGRDLVIPAQLVQDLGDGIHQRKDILAAQRRQLGPRDVSQPDPIGPAILHRDLAVPRIRMDTVDPDLASATRA